MKTIEKAETDLRSEILNILSDISAEYPGMRFGQLVSNIAIYACGPVEGAAYNVEDKSFKEAAQKYLADIRKRQRLATTVSETITALRQKSA